MPKLEDRVETLEELIRETAYIQMQNQILLRELEKDTASYKEWVISFSREMKEFKEEMKDFKTEMKDFKEESVAERREMNIRWGNLANKLGTFVEDVASPNVRRLAESDLGCGGIIRFLVRVRARNPLDLKDLVELDIVAAGEKAVAVCEAKSSPRIRDIEEFASFLSEGRLYRYFPEYREMPVVGVFASLFLSDDLVAALTHRGIYTLAMGSETMELLNWEELGSA